jgi:hypothetical protein
VPGPSVGLELACAGILAFYAATQLLGESRRTFPGEAVAIALGAVVGEDTCVRAYGFYDYAAGWSAKLDRVPLLVALIWPAVVLSARAVAGRLVGRDRPLRLAVVTGAIVVFDASLIEPIAVKAGLWAWTEPGVFDVPLVGLLGWGFYAGLATFVLAQGRRVRWTLPLVAPLGTHVLLVVTWWGGLRWILRGPVAGGAALAAAAAASALYTAAVVRRRPVLAGAELAARASATAFFGWLLVASGDAPLALFAALFAPPYVCLTALSITSGRRAGARA